MTGVVGGVRARLARGYRLAAAPLGRRAVRRAVAAGLAPELGVALASLFETHAAPDPVAQRIEARRAELAAAPAVYAYTPVPTPHGPARWAVAVESAPAGPRVTSRWLATSSSVPPYWGRFLRRCADVVPPGLVLELGALAGISGAYLGFGRGCARLLTIEGSPTFARIAAETFAALRLEARVLQATFDDGLGACLDGGASPAIALGYVDGHHDGTATRAYVQRLTPALRPGALLVLDDITLNQGMWAAWRALSVEAGWSVAVHTGRFGVLQRAPAAERPRRLDLSRFTGRWPIGDRTPTSPPPPDASR